MSRFYQVAGLKPASEIVEVEHALRVDLAAALLRPLSTNDEDILATRQKGEYVWVSGGGSWLLNKRYLLLVQRPLHAKVNSGKFSLFTGRADNMEELLHPTLLVRELFEELILFDGDRLYRPECTVFGEIIGGVYENLKTDLGLEVSAARPLPLKYTLYAPKLVTVINDGVPWEGMLDCHVSSGGEINILFVLDGDVRIKNLRAMDGEYHLVEGKAIRQNRKIYLYDLNTGMAQDITVNGGVGKPIPISEESMSEHLRHLLGFVKRSLVTGGSEK